MKEIYRYKTQKTAERTNSEKTTSAYIYKQSDRNQNSPSANKKILEKKILKTIKEKLLII